MFDTRQSKCRYYHGEFDGKAVIGKCRKWSTPNGPYVPVTKEQCETCEDFKSRFIEFPITVNSLEIDKIRQPALYADKIGSICEVRPCDERCGGKTYAGILLGELTESIYGQFNEDTGTLSIRPAYNPAIFVPELKRIVFGYECWWHMAKDESELQQITDDMIAGQWYVQLFKAMTRNGETAK